MASLGGSVVPPDLQLKIIYAGIATVLFVCLGVPSILPLLSKSHKSKDHSPALVKYFLFFYSCFLKPHNGDGKGNQQDALESFYKKQAGVYDATRSALLQGREDMLALAAAQLKHKAEAAGKDGVARGRVWVDVGGGTGYNIEAMAEFVNVPEFFSSVYLVDFSPSLCDVARKRFARLGWRNVKVVCEDARKFRLMDSERDPRAGSAQTRHPTAASPLRRQPGNGGADLVTMSYSLSMIPDYYSVVDSLPSLLAPAGIVGVVDFYGQSSVDVSFRNYTGGLVGRHVNWFARTFWRAWFDIDRVSLEPGRRDYLEYQFGTLLTVNARNYTLGVIPYYIWLGCHKTPPSSSQLAHEVIDRVDSLITELPCSRSADQAQTLSCAIEGAAPEMRSKAFAAAVQNISANLPLPSFFYQNHHWRIYYDEQLKKHTDFKDQYIYAFTWEDTRVDERLLKLGADDVVLAITSAGDNVLSYALQSPARIHAVDLNPTQNHLLELKMASYSALEYEDFWKIFGEGKHPGFRSLLVSKLSPHLSSRAFQYWLANTHIFTSRRGRGLYDTGGSRHGIRIFRWLSRAFSFRGAVLEILEARTLNEQREIWRRRIRPWLCSRLVSSLIVSSEVFLWAALGVPRSQLAMIEADHAAVCASGSPLLKDTRAHAVWRYLVDTLDPVVDRTHIATDNPYYHVCLRGAFSPRCRPDYLTPRAHARLGRAGALDRLRIHTDELDEVLARLAPGSLSVAVVMDSMDWFDPAGAGAGAAHRQIDRLNRALRTGGRVLLRSSGLVPWYVSEFEARGFAAKRVGHRRPGECIDRVNMYASCWVCTKTANLPPPRPEAGSSPPSGAGVSILSL